ncbi:hypothetical protein B2J86_06125 [Acidovorax sp. SRB_14]|nr:hypothetical protein [Acidovorax sp. SRB_14]
MLAAAAALSLGVYAPDASALALGTITVQSALGEPLRAEIDLPQITPAEAESLRASTAPPEVFRAQGMEYSTTAPQVQMQLQRRADGRTVLRLSSSNPVNDPFLDLVVNATWGAGRISRSYTLLLDPPTARKAPASPAALPQAAAPAASPARSAAAAAPRAAPAARPTPTSPEDGAAVTVRRGDTAGRIAGAHRPDGVSLDQMLVALVRSNPSAFIDGNVNRIKAGAVLQLPSEAQAQAVPAGEARQIVAVQSRDFNAFRRKLAGAAPATVLSAAERSATGAVQAHTEDQLPTSTAPDKLTLSKGALQGQKATEELLAQRKQAHAASARVEELAKNIEELNQLSASSGTAPAPDAAASATGPGPSVSNPGLSAAPVAASAEPVAPAVASTGAAAAETPAAPVPEATPAPAPAQPSAASAPAASAAPAAAPESGMLSDLLDEPTVPLAAGALLALLLGYGGYRVVQRRRLARPADSAFIDSRAQPDSFFGASGGQRVNTANSESTTGTSSLAYSPSQLDAGGDVDPVAEADVYLAYGRDLQAEEILKEAARQNPSRVAVHAKLGDIYAKRQDRKALEAVARDVLGLTDGAGPDWARLAELGRELDPENPLYRSRGASPAATDASAPAPAPAFAPPAPLPALDLDLDFDLPDDALTEAPPPGQHSFAAAAAAAAIAHAAAPSPRDLPAAPPAVEDGAPELPQLGDDPDAEPAFSAPEPDPVASPPAIAPPDMADMDFPLDLPPLDSVDTEPAPLATEPASFTVSDSGMMEFDLGHLSLDLGDAHGDGTDGAEPALPGPALPDDPLATKLALAQEFNTIGDSEGARTLIEEVIAESSGDLKTRAQRLLSELA